MKASWIEKKLEAWEEIAFSQSWGSDWLEQIGEGFKFYARACADENRRMSISGFMLWLAERAPEGEGKA